MGQANAASKRDNRYELPSAPQGQGRVRHAPDRVTRLLIDG